MLGAGRQSWRTGFPRAGGVGGVWRRDFLFDILIYLFYYPPVDGLQYSVMLAAFFHMVVVHQFQDSKVLPWPTPAAVATAAHVIGRGGL